MTIAKLVAGLSGLDAFAFEQLVRIAGHAAAVDIVVLGYLDAQSCRVDVSRN